MTKKYVLKMAIALVAMVVFHGAMAQTHDGTAIPGQANVAAYGDDGITRMVKETTVPLYAEPDQVYHSAWDYSAGVWTLTDGFIWTWSVTVGTPANVGFSQNNAEDNYVAVTISETGTYTISVTETAPAAYGGCSGSASTIQIVVVDSTSATLGALAGLSQSFCAGAPGIPTEIPVVISDGWQNYRLVWSLEIATLGAGLVKEEWWASDKTSLGVALAYAEEYTAAVPEEVAAAGSHDIMSVAGPEFTVIDGKPTVYTYTLTSINDQALRFGDFIALNGNSADPAAFTYINIGETYTVQINPAPDTGPIFHIPADWAQ